MIYLQYMFFMTRNFRLYSNDLMFDSRRKGQPRKMQLYLSQAMDFVSAAYDFLLHGMRHVIHICL